MPKNEMIAPAFPPPACGGATFHESDAVDEVGVVLSELSCTGALRVLEAGCGRHTCLDFGPEAYVVGIDIEPQEIGRNGRLSEAIVGDIQTYHVPSRSFDIAVCWNVLEHLESPERALENICGALRPGGLLVVGVPELRSLKTRLVKLTPAWLHRWAWRRLYPNASHEHGPFSLVLDDGVGATEIERCATANSMTVIYSKGYESAMQAKLRKSLGVGDRAWRLLHAALAGRVDVLHSDRVLILRKGTA